MSPKYLLLLISCLLFSCSTQRTVWMNHEPIVTSSQAQLLTANSADDLMPEAPDATELLWDEWGVPHIYAQNNDELFYTFGYAQMTSHANTILKLYAKSRGRAAEYWGADYIENDQMVHTLGFSKLGNKWYELQTDEFRGYLDQFIAGMNDYAEAHSEAIEDNYKVVLPLHPEDVMKHSLFVLYGRFVGGNDLWASSKWEERGSNTYAVGPSRSASGNAMLVMNPHLPWNDEWLFYEGHFNAPNIHMYGATLVGLPSLGIAFNENLGWSHTNNTIDNSDLYEIQLKDDGYIVDGEVRPLKVEKFSLKIKGDDGKIIVKDVPRYISPDHGPIIKREGEKALTIKMPGYDRPYGMVQWWKMASAKNIVEFKDALREVQIPFFNIMYADKAGNIFYMFNGQVPKREVGDWDYWQGVVDGSTSENLWEDVHDYYELPKTQNPMNGYLQNANDPPWTSTFPNALDPNLFPAYMSPVEMGFRPQWASLMMESDNSITFDELVDFKTSTHVAMADRLLDDLNAAVDDLGSDASREAMKVLNAWDRKADGSSKGMALFYAWAHTLGPNNSKIYKTPWNLENALTTPDGLANPQVAVQALDGVVAKFKESDTPLDVPWGTVYRIKYNDKDLPGNGSDGSVGMFRVAWSGGLEDDGKYYIQGGDSWQSVIEFGDEVKAKVLMSYGNSTQKGSPHYGDQLELFSKKEMRDCYFYREDVESHVKKRLVMNNGILMEEGLTTNN